MVKNTLCQQWGPPGSPTIASHFIQMATDSASWHCCTLCLQVSLNLIEVLYPPFEQSFVAIFHQFFSFVHVQGGYSAMGFKLFDDVEHSGHRHIKISGELLVALRFHNFGSQILRQFFALLSFLHAQYGTHRHTTQRLSQLFSILTGCKCDFYITSSCYLPQVSLNTN